MRFHQKLIYAAVTAVTSLSMRTPHYCPYCEQTSMRKGNLSTHIQRKHPKQYNPFPQMKQLNCNFSQPKNPEPSNFLSPRYDLTDPAQYFENSRKFQNVLQEITQWNTIELIFLLQAIPKIPNFSNYSSFF